MDDRVRGAAASEDSAGRRRRRALRAISAGYPMRRWPGAATVAASLWLLTLVPALAESGSRYSAPLWTWIAAIAVSIGLSAAGLAIGVWFRRKRSRLQ